MKSTVFANQYFAEETYISYTVVIYKYVRLW